MAGWSARLGQVQPPSIGRPPGIIGVASFDVSYTSPGIELGRSLRVCRRRGRLGGGIRDKATFLDLGRGVNLWAQGFVRVERVAVDLCLGYGVTRLASPGVTF
jgi:hypothetical protein